MDTFEIPSLAARRLRDESRAPDKLIGGRRLAAPRVTDRPRLFGWSGLYLARPHL